MVNIVDRPTWKVLARKEIEDHGVLSEFESRPFWLSWKNGHLRVGAGSTVGENEILEYADSLKDVTSLSLATYNNTVAGIWDLTFPDDTSEYSSLFGNSRFTSVF